MFVARMQGVDVWDQHLGLGWMMSRLQLSLPWRAAFSIYPLEKAAYTPWSGISQGEHAVMYCLWTSETEIGP